MLVSLVFIFLRALFLTGLIAPVIYAGYQHRSLNIVFVFAVVYALSRIVFLRRRPKTHDPQAILLPMWMKIGWQLFRALLLSSVLFFIGALMAKLIGGSDLHLGFTKLDKVDYQLLGLFSAVLVILPLIGMSIAKLTRFPKIHNNDE